MESKRLESVVRRFCFKVAVSFIHTVAFSFVDCVSLSVAYFDTGLRSFLAYKPNVIDPRTSSRPLSDRELHPHEGWCIFVNSADPCESAK